MGKFSSSSKNSKPLLALSLAASLALHAGGLCFLLNNPFAVSAENPNAYALTKEESLNLPSTFKSCFERMIVEKSPNELLHYRNSESTYSSDLISSAASSKLSYEVGGKPAVRQGECNPTCEKVSTHEGSRKSRIETTPILTENTQAEVFTPLFTMLQRYSYPLLALYQKTKELVKYSAFPTSFSALEVPKPYLATDVIQKFKVFPPTPSLTQPVAHTPSSTKIILPHISSINISSPFFFKIPHFKDKSQIIESSVIPEEKGEIQKQLLLLSVTTPAISTMVNNVEIDAEPKRPSHEVVSSLSFNRTTSVINRAIETKERVRPSLEISSTASQDLYIPRWDSKSFSYDHSTSNIELSLPGIASVHDNAIAVHHSYPPSTEGVPKIESKEPLPPYIDAYSVFHDPAELNCRNIDSNIALNTVKPEMAKTEIRRDLKGVSLGPIKNTLAIQEMDEGSVALPPITPAIERSHTPILSNRGAITHFSNHTPNYMGDTLTIDPVDVQSEHQALELHTQTLHTSRTPFTLTRLPTIAPRAPISIEKRDQQMIKLSEGFLAAINRNRPSSSKVDRTPQIEPLGFVATKKEIIFPETWTKAHKTPMEALLLSHVSFSIEEVAALLPKKHTIARKMERLQTHSLISSLKNVFQENNQGIAAVQCSPESVTLAPPSRDEQPVEVATSPNHHRELLSKYQKEQVKETAGVAIAEPKLNTRLPGESTHSAYEKGRHSYGNLAAIPSTEALETLSFGDSFETQVEYRKSKENGYDFAVTLKPKPHLQMFTASQHLVFVVDSSSSIKKHRYEVFKEGVFNALKYLKDGDTFSLLFVDSKIDAYSRTPTDWNKENVQLARRFIEKRPYKGLITRFSPFDILREVNGYLSDTKQNVVILITDGNKLDTIAKHRDDLLTLESEQAGNFALFTAAASSHNNLGMLDLLSAMNNGEMMYSQTNAAFPRKLAVFVKHIEKMLAKHVSLNQVGKATNGLVFASNSKLCPPLFSDRPYVVYGHTQTLEDFDIMIQAFNGTQFINVLQRISFEKAVQGGSKLDRNYGLQQAYTCYDRFIHESDPALLEEADSLLTHRGIPSAVR